jgi:hypothetical protein
MIFPKTAIDDIKKDELAKVMRKLEKGSYNFPWEQN